MNADDYRNRERERPTEKCPCGNPAAQRCVECGRWVCPWHCVGRPFFIAKKSISVDAVCHPDCAAPYWKNPKGTPEWRPSSQ